jgi:DNA polymerase III subunit delta'
MTPPFLGHESTYASLIQMLKEGRLPHALLFTGPEGIGKQRVARYLVKALFCEKSPEGCGSCPACELLEQEKHPDLLLLKPEEGRLKIDAIREIKKDLSFSPFMGTVRVVLVIDAHTMNAAAANALLKTLEEPPVGTYFILITHSMGWLPKTIVSRCQKIRFSPLPDPIVEAILKKEDSEKGKVDAKLLRWAQGSPLRAMELSRVEGELPAVARLLPKKDALNFDEAHQLAQVVAEEETLTIFLEALLCDTHQLLTQKNSAHDFDFDLLNFADKILQMRRDLRLNANPKIQLTQLLMSLQEASESRL